jgi:HNH endonuclease
MPPTMGSAPPRACRHRPQLRERCDSMTIPAMELGDETPADQRLPDRFWVKTRVEDTGYETPCLTWIAYKTAAGYGRISWQGKNCLAHRVAYEVLVAPIPEGLTVDHLCRNRACVNVDHLEPVTQGENVRRGTNPFAINAAKTHCKRGHEFTEANTRVSKAGNRNCITCLEMRRGNGWSAWNAKRREQRAEARKNRPPKPRKPRWAGRTHCSKGHLLADAGIYVDKTGKPYCRECIRIRSRRAYWKKRSATDEAA